MAEQSKTLDELSIQAGVDPTAVRSQQEQFSGLTNEAAIGNVAGQPVSGIFSDNAVETVNNQKTKLDQISPEQQAFNEGSAKRQEEINQFGKPDEEVSKGASFSLEEARDLFGSDFTGITQQADGSFTADASALNRIGLTGVQDAGALETGLSQVEGQIEGLVNNFLTLDLDKDPEFQQQSNQIKSQFDKLRNDVRDINKRREATFRTLGIRGGSAQFAGSIAEGVIGEEVNQGIERLAEISRQEASAISAARTAFRNNRFNEFSQTVSALSLIREQKADELNRFNQTLADQAKALNDQAKIERENLKFLAQEQRLLDRLGLDRDKFNAGKERDERTRDLEELKFVKDVSEDERNQTLTTLTQLAQSGINIEQFSDEDRSIMEATAGLPGGTLESFFGSLVKDAQQGRLLDDLTVQQKRATLSNTLRLARGGGASGTGFTNSQEQKLEQAGLLNAPRQDQLDFLFQSTPTLQEVKESFSQDIAKGEPLGSLLDTLFAQGFDPFASSLFFLTEQAITDEIKRGISQGLTEKEIRTNLSDQGLNDAEINQFNKEINEAPNKFTRFIGNIGK